MQHSGYNMEVFDSDLTENKAVSQIILSVQEFLGQNKQSLRPLRILFAGRKLNSEALFFSRSFIEVAA